MFILFTALCYIEKENCHNLDTIPTVRGNSLTKYVSEEYVAKINAQEETPIQIEEKPAKEFTILVDNVSELLVKEGYASKELADKIQNRFKYTGNLSASFNDFGCNDMSSKFNSLPDGQKNVNNFWNKIINRAAVLIIGHKVNNSVTFKVKRVAGQIKKRWAVLNKQNQMHSYPCTVEYQVCGTHPKSEHKCSYEYDSKLKKSTRKCKNVITYEYKCDTKTRQVLRTKTYHLYKYDFTDSWDKNEIEKMFASAQEQIADRLHF